MVTTGFGICLIISVLVTLFMVFRNEEHIDSYSWSITVFLPFLIMGYWLKTQVSTSEAALVLFTYINLVSALLLVVVLFSMLHNLGIVVRVWMKAICYGAAFVQLFPVWRTFYQGIPGDMIQIKNTGNGYATRMSEGSFAFVHYPYILAIIIVMIGIIAVLKAPKKNYSRRTLTTYMGLVGAGIVIYGCEAILDTDFSALPYLYMVGDILIATNYDRVHAHEISNLISQNQDSNSTRGYVALGLNGWFLSANKRCFDFLPELKNQRVDARLSENTNAAGLLYGMIDRFRNDGISTGRFKSGDMICACEVSTFSVRKYGPELGYLFDIRDTTEEQKTLEILSDYNSRLNQEVAEKTHNIEMIQQKIVLGMADMVENRDSNTGGHVKRTSDIIRILVDEIQSRDLIPLEDTFARNIVRAAPMHDLGKVSIDSGILNKPGRLTAEEYDIMKTHSTISGQMVHILLEGVEEENFVRTAYNVARYHHERWDGKGYPEGLVGEMIPLEARIMAVADVYDALVSKRVYKEPMSYEQAARIMYEGMGTQFDPNMRSIFFYCREKLERYYSFVS